MIVWLFAKGMAMHNLSHGSQWLFAKGIFAPLPARPPARSSVGPFIRPSVRMIRLPRTAGVFGEPLGSLKGGTRARRDRRWGR